MDLNDEDVIASDNGKIALSSVQRTHMTDDDAEEESVSPVKTVGNKRKRSNDTSATDLPPVKRRAPSSGNTKKSKTLTERASLTFPVARTLNQVRECITSKRVAASAAVKITAAVEYIMAEVLEVSADVARSAKRKTINPQFIMLGIRGDDELSAIFPNACFVGAGAKPLPRELRHSFFPRTSKKFKETTAAE